MWATRPLPPDRFQRLKSGAQAHQSSQAESGAWRRDELPKPFAQRDALVEQPKIVLDRDPGHLEDREQNVSFGNLTANGRFARCFVGVVPGEGRLEGVGPGLIDVLRRGRWTEIQAGKTGAREFDGIGEDQAVARPLSFYAKNLPMESPAKTWRNTAHCCRDGSQADLSDDSGGDDIVRILSSTSSCCDEVSPSSQSLIFVPE